MSEREKIVVLDGARTPIGSFGGVSKSAPGFELGAVAAKAALKRSSVSGDDVDEVVFACIEQVGADAYNARRVAVATGMSTRIPASTVNRLCGSGLQAIWSAAMQMRWGGVDFALVGGGESMTRMPFYDFGARDGYRLGNRTLVDGTVMMLTDPFDKIHRGITAENVAAKYGVSRQKQDEFALLSQQPAASESAKSAFAEEIVPVEVGGRKPYTISLDEHPKPATTLETFAGLRPAFTEGGTVTAGNASGINDGAAAVLLVRESVAAERGLTRLVTLEAVATAANEPDLMGYAPTYALSKLFKQTGLAPSDIDIVELDEAFASQAVAVIRDAKLDPERTNPYGGAIALGHPVGATGANLPLRVAKHLARVNGESGVVTMCIGGGQALAALFPARRMSDAPVVVDVDSGVAHITLNRPEHANAVDLPMAHAFGSALDRIEAEDVRVVLLEGAGPRFCAGGDVRLVPRRERATRLPAGTRHRARVSRASVVAPAQAGRGGGRGRGRGRGPRLPPGPPTS